MYYAHIFNLYEHTHTHNISYCRFLRIWAYLETKFVQMYLWCSHTMAGWPQFHILFRRLTCEKPMWWHLGPRGLARVMSLQAMGGQRLPAIYWRLGWGQGRLPKSAGSAALQKPWSQNPGPRLTMSIVTSTRFVTHCRSTPPNQPDVFCTNLISASKWKHSFRVEGASHAVFTLFPCLSGCGWGMALK